MRERVTKCKVADLTFHHCRAKVAAEAISPRSTRSRKLVAETPFCCESNPSHCIFSAQTKRANVKMTGENSPQKSFSGQMKAYFALHNSFAHFRPFTAIKGKHMKNEIGISACDTCPICAGKQKVVTLPDGLERDEKQEAWVPLTASICDKCGQTTIHTFHLEMFTTLPTKDKNEELRKPIDLSVVF
jgi:hypothetical protein